MLSQITSYVPHYVYMTFQNKILNFSQSDYLYVLSKWMNTMILWQPMMFDIICRSPSNNWCWHIIDCAYWKSCFVDRKWFVSPNYVCAPVDWCKRSMFRTVMLGKYKFLMKLES